MGERAPEDRILTIPNVISFIRLLGVVFFWWVILVPEDLILAAVFIIVISLTDWVDGYLARRLNQVTNLGKTLDPVADRLMIASAVIGGLIVGAIPPVIGWTLIAREVFMGGVSLYLMSKGGGTLEVRYWGKVATFILYSAIPGFYLAKGGFLEALIYPAAWIASIVGLAIYWVVAFQYLGDARTKLAQLESVPDPEEV